MSVSHRIYRAYGKSRPRTEESFVSVLETATGFRLTVPSVVRVKGNLKLAVAEWKREARFPPAQVKRLMEQRLRHDGFSPFNFFWDVSDSVQTRVTVAVSDRAEAAIWRSYWSYVWDQVWDEVFEREGRSRRTGS